MANYRKSFNLRNGVQVDDDNFIVNANGLVGIGTSVPTEFLDVRGNIKVVGLVTANNLYAGIATISNLTATGVSVSGVVTAASFSGSASGLTGIYAIAVDGWYTNAGNISTTSNVGVGTTNPQGTLQIGTGVTFNSSGSATYSGIITAFSFDGVGSNITSINASNISSGTLSNSRLPSDINVSGVVTATSFVGNVTGNLTGNVTGNVTGTASTAQTLTGTPNITVGVVTATKIIADSIEVNATPSGITTISKLLHVGTGGTAFAALESGRIGVGTAVPTSDVQVRKSNGTLVEVISDTSQARISIGQSVGAGKSTAVLRFGDTLKNFDIINNDTGSINMYLHNGPSGVGTGRFSWIYGQNNNELVSLTYNGNFGIGITNPSSNLHVVGTSTVTGNANFGSNVTITGNLVAGSITLPSVISDSNLNNSSGVSTVTNLLVAPVGVGSIGINTTDAIAGLDARAVDGLFNRIGVNTSSFGTELLNVNGASRFGSIGIGTSASTAGAGLVITNEIQQYNSTTTLTNSILYVVGTSGVGIGTTSVRAALDCADAGKINPGLLPGEGTGSRAYFLPPRLTNTQRTGLTTEAGAIIYNTSTNKHQGWNGTTWNDLY
jgi:hypothetical protein